MKKLLPLFLAVFSLSSFASTELMEPGFRGRLPISKQVFGVYKRQQVTNASKFEHRIIGQVGSHCSGTLIGKKHVLTAAHCVYDQEKDKWFSDLNFHPGRVKGSASPYGEYKWKRVFIQKEYINGGRDEYDFAVIELEKDAGDELGWRGFRSVDARTEKSDQITITGYPGDKENGTMWTVNCPVSYEDVLTLHKCDTFGGMSGASLISQRKEDTTPFITGVHVSGSKYSNSAVTLNEKNFKLILSWVKDTTYSSNTYVQTKPKLTSDKIFFLNGCHKEIQVAIRFNNLNENWVTNGFWRLKPGQKVQAAETRNTVYYSWATDLKGDLEWTGNHKVSFNGYTLHMKEKNITSKEWGDWTEEFVCN